MVVIMSIPIEIKKQLSSIIKNSRIYKYERTKKYKWKKTNPYTKENLCKNICHYYTLTKLEEEYIINDETYRLLLNKLGYLYDVKNEEHLKNINKAACFLDDILKAVEYIDDNLMVSIDNKLSKIDFHCDCIANMHIYLLKVLIKLYFLNFLDDYYIEQLKIYKDIYSGLFKRVYYYILGIIYINQRSHNKAYTAFLEAHKKIDSYQDSKGLINTQLMLIYMLKRDYLSMVNLSLEMENYFQNTNNFKRLLHVYFYLTNYFLIIKSHNMADIYYKKSIKIIHNDKSLKRYYFALEYNKGLNLFNNYMFNDALEHMKEALNHTTKPQRKLQIINYIILLMMKLKYSNSDIKSMIQLGKESYKYGVERDQYLLKYFTFKYDNNSYYRRYAIKKLIPLLRSHPTNIDILLLIYQDLYE